MVRCYQHGVVVGLSFPEGGEAPGKTYWAGVTKHE
jgi:hypothetical protein